MRNVNLYIARDTLPAVEEDDTFYCADLIGLSAVTRDKSAFGEVIAVQNYGAGDILEIRRGDGSTFLVPFTEAAVPEIDIAGGIIVIDPPRDAPDSEKPEA